MGSNEEDSESRPDIIIHKRMSDKKNLVVIEVKKNSGDSYITDSDEFKLSELTKKADLSRHSFYYHYGILLDFQGDRAVRLTWFVAGHELEPCRLLTARMSEGGVFFDIQDVYLKE